MDIHPNLVTMILLIDIIISEWEEETVYFNKSLVTIDNFETCDDQNNLSTMWWTSS